MDSGKSQIVEIETSVRNEYLIEALRDLCERAERGEVDSMIFAATGKEVYTGKCLAPGCNALELRGVLCQLNLEFDEIIADG